MSVALARRAFLRAFSNLRGEQLEIVEPDRCLRFGPADAELGARIEIRDPRAYAKAIRGSTGLGEAYADGLWTADDLVAVVRIACRRLAPFDRWRRRIHPVVGPFQRALDSVPRNTRNGARTNISAHYDLGNELFEAFLDPRLVYSCAHYADPDATLEQAQLAKLDRICDALDLGPDDHLLEIGTGWGALAVHAASTRSCRVTTTTISSEQHAFATELVQEADLGTRVEVLLCDYRDLEGSFDKLVSIEMIEAVGWQYFPVFFDKCAELIHPQGAMFLQAIVIREDLYEHEKAARSFANTHVFPGGCLPSAALITRLSAASGMPVAWLDDIGAHYPPTLAAWRDRFNDSWPRLRSLGYDERFKRLWNFYLASSEAGFRERRISNVQLLLTKAEHKRHGRRTERTGSTPAPDPVGA